MEEENNKLCFCGKSEWLGTLRQFSYKPNTDYWIYCCDDCMPKTKEEAVERGIIPNE
mgnify:CR=1 FL=1